MAQIASYGPETASHEIMRGVDLSGRFAVITGGSGGLGYETAKSLIAAGADVFIGARTPGKLEEAAAALRSEFPQSFV